MIGAVVVAILLAQVHTMPADEPLWVPVQEGIVTVEKGVHVEVPSGMFFNDRGVAQLAEKMSDLNKQVAAAKAREASLQQSLQEISAKPDFTMRAVLLVCLSGVVLGVGGTLIVQRVLSDSK